VPRPRRAIASLLAFVGGAAAGVLGSFVHGNEASGVPVGLITAFGLCLSFFVAAGLATRSRAVAGLAVAGWLLAVLLLSWQRPEGDLVVPGTTLGYLWLFGGMAVAGAALAVNYAVVLPARRRESPASTAAAPAGR
jgi:hypothetical protein